MSSESKSAVKKGKPCKCSKCDLVNNIVLLFYNVNCQHILCVKCLQLLGHVSQLKCDTLLKNDAKCDALWTRKSTKILTYVDPLFINAVNVELKSYASLNVDKSDTSVEVCLDSAALKMLRNIKPCIPGLPTLESNPMMTSDSGEGVSDSSQHEIKSLDSPPRKRAKKSDGGTQEEKTPAPRKTTARQISQAASATKTPVQPKPRTSATDSGVTKTDSESESTTSSVAKEPNPLLNRPLSSVENKPQNKIKLNATNDPATYKKVMKKNFKGETQLHAACQKGLLDKAREWLELGSDPNTCDNANLRPIHEHGVILKPELCKLLLEFGAEVNVPGGDENLMPIHIAISNNCVDTAEVLIKFGADLSATGKDASGNEFTAMSLAEKMAAEYGCGDLLKVVKETKREVFEAVKPPVAIVSAPPPKQLRPTIFSVSGLSDEERSIVSNFAEKFPERVTLSQNYNNDCNVLVCGKSKTKASGYPPSIKVLAAILTNGMVIDIAWMRDSLANRTYLEYDNYLIDSICNIKGGVARAREAGKPNERKIFHGLKFHVNEKLQTFKYHEICLLIEIGDGQLLGNAPENSAGKKLLNDPKVKVEYLKEDSMICDMRLVFVTENIFGHIEKIMDGTYKVSPDYIVNCVASFSLPSNVFPHCSSVMD